MVIAARSSSVQVTSGRAREASIAAGESCPPGGCVFLRLVGGSEGASLEDRFLETRLAALMICFERFSSVKIARTACRSDLERVSGLRKSLALRNGPDCLVGIGMLLTKSRLLSVGP